MGWVVLVLVLEIPWCDSRTRTRMRTMDEAGFLKHFRLQAGHVTHGLRDVGKRFQRQMSALRVKHRPRGGVNLHEWNVRTRRLQFLEPMRVFLDFFGQRLFAVDGREQALD